MFFTAQPKIIMKCNLHTSNQTVLDFTLQVLLVMPRVKDYRQLFWGTSPCTSCPVFTKMRPSYITGPGLSVPYHSALVTAALRHPPHSADVFLKFRAVCENANVWVTCSGHFPSSPIRVKCVEYVRVSQCVRMQQKKVREKEVTYTNINLDWVLSASDSLQSVHIFKTVSSVNDMSFKLIIRHHKTPTHDTLLL